MKPLEADDCMSAADVRARAATVAAKRRQSYRANAPTKPPPTPQPVKKTASPSQAVMEETEKIAINFLAYTSNGTPPPRAQNEPIISVKEIIIATAHHFGMPVRELLSARRLARVVLARHVGMYLAKKLTRNSYMQIGGHFDRDHASVLHGVRCIMTRLEYEMDTELQAAINAIERKVLA